MVLGTKIVFAAVGYVFLTAAAGLLIERSAAAKVDQLVASKIDEIAFQSNILALETLPEADVEHTGVEWLSPHIDVKPARARKRSRGGAGKNQIVGSGEHGCSTLYFQGGQGKGHHYTLQFATRTL